MKRIISLMLISALFVSVFCACKQEKAEVQETVSYNEEILVEKASDFVEEWYYDSGEDGYAVPQFNVDSKGADTLNKELSEKYTDIKEKGKEKGYLHVEMQGSVYKNLAFILVETTKKDEGAIYEVYSISLGTGEKATNEEVYRCFDVSKITCYGAVYDALSNEYKVNFHSFSDSSAGAYSKYRKKTLAKENVYNSTLYINNRGQLSAVGTIYSIDGETEFSCAVAAIDPPLKKTQAEN